MLKNTSACTSGVQGKKHREPDTEQIKSHWCKICLVKRQKHDNNTSVWEKKDTQTTDLIFKKLKKLILGFKLAFQ